MHEQNWSITFFFIGAPIGIASAAGYAGFEGDAFGGDIKNKHVSFIRYTNLLF